jgi:FtsP/CotA-like multicopper oxidase with cupredoxin domain
MWLIAVDGNPTTQPVLTTDLFLGAGARMEVVVQGPPAGTYNLVSLAIDTRPQGDPNPQVTLAQVVSSPSTRTNPIDPRTLRAAKLDSQTAELAKRPAAAQSYPQRQFTFSETSDGNTFFINGKEYDPSRIDTTIKFPTVEEWTIFNTSQELTCSTSTSWTSWSSRSTANRFPPTACRIRSHCRTRPRGARRAP